MNEFNLLVLNIAGIVLIGALLVIGIMLYYASKDQQFPPIVSDCPTFYRLDGSNNCVLNDVYSGSGDNPMNFPSLAKKSSVEENNSTGSQDVCHNINLSLFNTLGTTAKDIKCAKKQWADKCDVYWSGISNDPDSCVKSS